MLGAMTLARRCAKLEALTIAPSRIEITDHLQPLGSEYHQVALQQEC